jgi:CRISPR-associated endoribonuclease Cas6
MRIKVSFQIDAPLSIPIEYNYHIYLNVRKILFNFLTDKKPKLAAQYKKELPNFTFSQLMIPVREVEYGFISIQGRYFSLFVSSLDATFMEYLAKAFYATDYFPLFTHQVYIQKVEILEPPDFTDEMHFRMLSPLLLISKQNEGIYFVRPDDPNLNDVFSAITTTEYNTFNPQAPLLPQDIRITLNQDYLASRKSKTKLITVRNINYKAILSPFLLRGNPDLIRFCYENGIGDKTNFGFGMIEVAGF